MDYYITIYIYTYIFGMTNLRILFLLHARLRYIVYKSYYITLQIKKGIVHE